MCPRKCIRLVPVVPISEPGGRSNGSAAAQNYRSWVIWRCPTVRFLDFRRVKEVERERATGLFGSHDRPTELASKVNPLFAFFVFPSEWADRHLQCPDPRHKTPTHFRRRLPRGRQWRGGRGTGDTWRPSEPSAAGFIGAEAPRREDQERDESAGDCAAGENAKRGADTGRRRGRRCDGRVMLECGPRVCSQRKKRGETLWCRRVSNRGLSICTMARGLPNE